MTAPGPGKFEGCPDMETAERLYAESLNGGCDEECGTVDDGLWIGRIADTLLFQDARGFFTYDIRRSEDEARRVFAHLEAEASRVTG